MSASVPADTNYNFGLISTPAIFHDDMALPIEISENIQLDYSNCVEKKRIIHNFDLEQDKLGVLFPSLPQFWVASPSGTGKERDPNRAKFIVARYINEFEMKDNRNSQETNVLQKALCLSTADLNLSILLSRQNSGDHCMHFDIYSLAYLQRQGENLISDPKQLTLGHIDNIKETFKHIYDHKFEDYHRVNVAIKRFMELELYPEGDMKIVGYVGIWELLLVPTDTNRICHQLNKKLTVINDSLSDEMNLGADEAVKTLYKLRSKIAHGDETEKHITDINNRIDCGMKIHSISGYYRHITQCLLRYAVKEPDIVNDLRNSK